MLQTMNPVSPKSTLTLGMMGNLHAFLRLRFVLRVGRIKTCLQWKSTIPLGERVLVYKGKKGTTCLDIFICALIWWYACSYQVQLLLCLAMRKKCNVLLSWMCIWNLSFRFDKRNWRIPLWWESTHSYASPHVSFWDAHWESRYYIYWSFKE